MGVILDSSILVDAERRGQHVSSILEYIHTVHGEVDAGLSVVSVAELVHGAYRAKTVAVRLQRLAFIDELCLYVPVYPLTLELARKIGRIQGEQAAQGFTITFEDLAIGLTALELGFDVLTLNVRHFQLIPGLKVLSL